MENLELFNALRNALARGLSRDQLVRIVTATGLVPLTGDEPANVNEETLATTIAFGILPPAQLFSSPQTLTGVARQTGPALFAPLPQETSSSSSSSSTKMLPPLPTSSSFSQEKKVKGPSRDFRLRHQQRLDQQRLDQQPSLPIASQSKPIRPSKVAASKPASAVVSGIPNGNRLPPYSSKFTEEQKARYFLANAPLSDQNKKYCRGVRHIAAQQDAWCLKDVNARAGQTNPDTGKQCFNPYAVATARVGRDGAVSCFPNMDWTAIPAAEVEAEIALKAKKGVSTYEDLLALQARERERL